MIRYKIFIYFGFCLGFSIPLYTGFSSQINSPSNQRAAESGTDQTTITMDQARAQFIELFSDEYEGLKSFFDSLETLEKQVANSSDPFTQEDFFNLEIAQRLYPIRNPQQQQAFSVLNRGGKNQFQQKKAPKAKIKSILINDLAFLKKELDKTEEKIKWWKNKNRKDSFLKERLVSDLNRMIAHDKIECLKTFKQDLGSRMQIRSLTIYLSIEKTASLFSQKYCRIMCQVLGRPFPGALLFYYEEEMKFIKEFEDAGARKIELLNRQTARLKMERLGLLRVRRMLARRGMNIKHLDEVYQKYERIKQEQREEEQSLISDTIRDFQEISSPLEQEVNEEINLSSENEIDVSSEFELESELEDDEEDDEVDECYHFGNLIRSLELEQDPIVEELEHSKPLPEVVKKKSKKRGGKKAFMTAPKERLDREAASSSFIQPNLGPNQASPLKESLHDYAPLALSKGNIGVLEDLLRPQSEGIRVKIRDYNRLMSDLISYNVGKGFYFKSISIISTGTVNSFDFIRYDGKRIHHEYHLPHQGNDRERIPNQTLHDYRKIFSEEGILANEVKDKALLEKLYMRLERQMKMLNSEGDNKEESSQQIPKKPLLSRPRERK